MTRAIHHTLNSIEAYPKMYGTREAIELQYEMLLSILAAGHGIEDGTVRDIVMRVTFARVGEGCNSFLFARCATEDDLIAGLREIRAQVERLIQP